MSAPTITASPTSFGTARWCFRAPEFVSLLARCRIERIFGGRVELDPEGRVNLAARFWGLLGNGVVTELSVSKALPGITPAAFAAAVEATPSGYRPSGAPNPSRKPASGVPATRASRLFHCGNGKRIIARLFTRSNGHGRQAVGGQARTRSTFIATLREALGRSGKTLVAMRRALDEYGAGVLEAPDETVKVWSDLHLGHANIIAYQGRPFHNVHEMDGVLWANWQLGVDPEDTLIWTHAPLPNVPDGQVNIHRHQHSARKPADSPHINVSVEQLEYRPIRLDRLARALAAGEFLGGDTTLERLAEVER